MSRESTTATVGRCLALVVATTTALAALLSAVAPELGQLTAPLPAVGGFDALLARGATVLVVVGAAWVQLVVLATVAEVLAATVAGRRLRLPALAPRTVQRLLVAACGATAVVATALPAHATGTAVDPAAAAATGAQVGTAVVDLSGLPLPERFAGAAPTTAPAATLAATSAATPAPTAAPAAAPRRAPTAPPTGSLEVRPGDTLWALAAAHLVAAPEREDAAVVAAAVRDLHAANAATVPDPDLLRVGQRLVLPAAGTGSAGAGR